MWVILFFLLFHFFVFFLFYLINMYIHLYTKLIFKKNILKQVCCITLKCPQSSRMTYKSVSGKGDGTTILVILGHKMYIFGFALCSQFSVKRLGWRKDQPGMVRLDAEAKAQVNIRHSISVGKHQSTI